MFVRISPIGRPTKGWRQPCHSPRRPGRTHTTRTRRPPVHELGAEPDPRFCYANERTFQAWNRTALALVAAGLAATSLLPEFSVPGGRRLIGVPLIALGELLSIISYRRWEENEWAMRLGEPLPRSRLGLILAVGITAAALIATVVAAFGTAE